MSQRKPIIGVCGAIGAGKSAAAAALAECGGIVIDSDALQHEVLRRPEVVSELVAWWGSDICDATGAIDRRRVAQIVFADPAERARLEALTHPLIGARREDIIQRGLEDPAVRAFVLDSPLLFERQLDRLCDALVFVDASEPVRLARVARSRGWSPQELARRERWQMPADEKRRRCAYVLSNDGTLDELRSQARHVFDEVVSHHSAKR